MIDPISVVTLVSTVAAVINNVGTQIMAIKELHDRIKGADAHLMSLITQLNTMKAALEHIQELIESAHYEPQLVANLDLALQTSNMHMDFIAAKIAKTKLKKSSSTLKLQSKVKLVFEEHSMCACLERLNHQATALNLLITVLTSKTVTEQKNILQRSNTRKIFQRIKDDKAVTLDDAASLHVLRDDASCVAAVGRIQSEPIIGRNPWKKFAFDHHVLNSRPYGRRAFSSRRPDEKSTIIGEIKEIDADYDREDLSTAECGDSISPPPYFEEESITKSQFTKVVAFSHSESNLSCLVGHAKQLWDATETTTNTRNISKTSTTTIHRLDTRYFELSIHVQDIGRINMGGLGDDVLMGHRDASSILFTVNILSYAWGDDQTYGRLQNDLALFGRIVNSHDLCRAKIVLLLDTTGFEGTRADPLVDDIKSEFLRFGGAGTVRDRVRVVVGNADETTAGTVFAVCNDIGRNQATNSVNKWAGLTQ